MPAFHCRSVDHTALENNERKNGSKPPKHRTPNQRHKTLALTMMKKRHWLRPFVRFKLPRLARREHTNHPVPRVRAELGERVHAVDDEILGLAAALRAGGVDGGVCAVERDDVLGPRGAFGVRAGACFSWGFETGGRWEGQTR